MKHIFYLLVFALFFSCDNSTNEETNESKKIVYDMYESSEMALLMNQMFEYNLKVKEEILKGEIPTEFPIDFLKIHTAEMSEFKSRNETFQSFSKVFIETEKQIFDENSTIDVKDRFNSAVNVCISCHQTECTGPIPRIQKLLIN